MDIYIQISGKITNVWFEKEMESLGFKNVKAFISKRGGIKKQMWLLKRE